MSAATLPGDLLRRLRSLPRAAAKTSRRLPTGDQLSEESWHRRHRWLCTLVWAHAVLLPIYGVLQGEALGHAVLEGGVLLGGLAALAGSSRLARRTRSMLATAGLVSASAVLVHFAGGLIEMHFHFFVVIVLVSLYQAWHPFLLALLVVSLHHGILGTVAPQTVYNHAAAVERPWLFGLLHAAFVLAASLACLVTWRLNEDALAGERRARHDLERLSQELSSAQQIASVGSWDWNRTTGEVWWSEEMHRIAGVPLDQPPSVATFLSLVHPEERATVDGLLRDAASGSGRLDYRARLLRADGEVVIVHCRGGAITGPEGDVRIIGTCQDVTSQVRMEREIEFRAHYDALTGLPNRARFLRLLGEATAATRARVDQVFVLCLDLDDFKTVNDTLGHSTGDRVLVEVADRLRTTIRPGDVVARLGGDEFAILLYDVDPEVARTVAARLLEALEAPVGTDQGSLAIRGSIGAAGSTRSEDPEVLLQHADIALYAAKDEAPGTVRVFAPDMLVRLTERAQLESELAIALEHDQLVVHYQPVYDLRTRRASDLEALVRWQHPTRGLLGPGEFIELAEQTGLIRGLGRQVLERALTDLAAYAAELGPEVGVSVNVSAQQSGAELLQHVPAALAASGIAAHRLTLEITESTLMDPTGDLIEALSSLRRTGVKVAIDDFGTGYSSLAYLRELPIDRLKIDRSFIRELDGGPGDTALVATIIDLARILELDTVAEGIETARQADLLGELGCAHGQGFHLARPGPLVDLLDQLRGTPVRT